MSERVGYGAIFLFRGLLLWNRRDVTQAAVCAVRANAPRIALRATRRTTNPREATAVGRTT